MKTIESIVSDVRAFGGKISKACSKRIGKLLSSEAFILDISTIVNEMVRKSKFKNRASMVRHYVAGKSEHEVHCFDVTISSGIKDRPPIVLSLKINAFTEV